MLPKERIFSGRPILLPDSFFANHNFLVALRSGGDSLRFSNLYTAGSSAVHHRACVRDLGTGAIYLFRECVMIAAARPFDGVLDIYRADGSVLLTPEDRSWDHET